MRKIKMLMVAVIVFMIAILPGIVTDAAPKNMYVHFINVGQGDSIYIKAPNGEDILIDGGNKDGSDVVAYLKKQKVKDIEIMIATHPDADHIGGLDEVLKAFPVKSVYAPKVGNTTQAYKDFLVAVKNKKLTRRVDYPIKSKGYRKKSTFPVECE